MDFFFVKKTTGIFFWHWKFFFLSLSQLFQVGSPTWKWIRWQKESTDPSRFSRFNQSVSSSARLQIRRFWRKSQRATATPFAVTIWLKMSERDELSDGRRLPRQIRGREQPTLCMAVILSSTHTHTYGAGGLKEASSSSASRSSNRPRKALV